MLEGSPLILVIPLTGIEEATVVCFYQSQPKEPIFVQTQTIQVERQRSEMYSESMPDRSTNSGILSLSSSFVHQFSITPSHSNEHRELPVTVCIKYS